MPQSALPPAYVISLPEAQHRRERITAQLEELGFPYSVFDGVDGRKMDVRTHPEYDTTRRHRYFGRDLLGGELGCFLSHKGVLQKIISDNIPCALVLEDDAIVQDALPAVIEQLSGAKPAPDLVRFIDKDKVYSAPQKHIANLTPEHHLVRIQSTPGGAYAYFISRQGAEKLLAHMDKTYLPVDTLMGYSWRTGVDNLVSIPSPVAHGDLEDTHIGDQRFDKHLQIAGAQKALYPLTRFAHKFSENIMKRVNFALHNRTRA